MGHYMAARICGVRVEEFSLGFGMPIFTFKDSSNTLWKICCFPIGGYVKMFGDKDITSASGAKIVFTQQEKAQSFVFQSPIRRFFIALAGPLANYILAFLIFFGIFAYMGKVILTNQVGEVLEDSPAFAAGIRKGDVITSLNDRPVNRFSEIQSYIILRPSQTLKVIFARGGEYIHSSVVTESRELKDERDKPIAKIGFIGISSTEPKLQRLGLLEAAAESIFEIKNITLLSIDTLAQMLTGYRSMKELRGAITVAKGSGDSLNKGYISFMIYIALISINIGFANLLPIPILDGGHIMFCLYEMIFGKAVSSFANMMLIKIGLLVVIFMFVISVSNDINALL
ncbi:MAG: RIP metalloprotease [Alphaproteobacteria bacterium]|nr:RIP metalloprotease [Alphaproteobacteria bacterium]